MRSDLVFRALDPTPGRYRLCRLTAQAGRRLHMRKSRMEDTLNDVLSLLSNSAVADGCVTGSGKAVNEPPRASASHVADQQPQMVRKLPYVECKETSFDNGVQW